MQYQSLVPHGFFRHRVAWGFRVPIRGLVQRHMYQVHAAPFPSEGLQHHTLRLSFVQQHFPHRELLAPRASRCRLIRNVSAWGQRPPTSLFPRPVTRLQQSSTGIRRTRHNLGYATYFLLIFKLQLCAPRARYDLVQRNVRPLIDKLPPHRVSQDHTGVRVLRLHLVRTRARLGEQMFQPPSASRQPSEDRLTCVEPAQAPSLIFHQLPAEGLLL